MNARGWILLLIWIGLAPQVALGQRPMRGPLPDEQRQLIHAMASAHDKFMREVELTETGYVAKTTSEDPEIVAMLQEHVAYMKKRIDGGGMVRRWDPAFVELLAHHEDIEVTIAELENGLEVVVEGKTPQAIEVAQNHANIVSGFVDLGFEAVHREHSAVLEKAASGE